MPVPSAVPQDENEPPFSPDLAELRRRGSVFDRRYSESLFSVADVGAISIVAERARRASPMSTVNGHGDGQRPPRPSRSSPLNPSSALSPLSSSPLTSSGSDGHGGGVDDSSGSGSAVVTARFDPSPGSSTPSPLGDPFILTKAQILLSDAIEGRASYFYDSRSRIQLYLSYHRLWARLLLFAFIVLDLSLALFETPNGDLGLLWPLAASVSVELVCLAVFATRLIHMSMITPRLLFWRDRKNVILIAAITLTVLDIVIYVILDATGTQSVRWSRVFRPLFLTCFSEFRQVRIVFRNIRKTLVGVANVIVLLLLTIALFALLCVELFKRRELIDVDGKPYFTDWPDAFFSLYVLMTSANFPDIMMPAMYYNRWYVLIFVFFIIISMYIFLSIVLAVVYENYRKYLQEEVQSSVRHRHVNIRRLFSLLAHKRHVYLRDWRILLLQRGESRQRADLLFQILDSNCRGALSEDDFLYTADVLNKTMRKVAGRNNIFQRFMPGVYNTGWSIRLRNAVKHWGFTRLFDFFILLNAVFIGVGLIDLETTFLVLFNLEIVLKIYALGPANYFKSPWNVFDFTVIWIATIYAIVDAALGEGFQSDFLEIIVLLRVLRLVKVLRSARRFQVVISTVAQLGPAIAIYGVMLLVVFYVYAIIGMEAYAGRVYAGNSSLNGSVFNESSPFAVDIHAKNPKLIGSQYAADGYYANNFNDIVSSFILLFELMVVNQWHVLTQGFVDVTSEASRFYFLSFHMLTVTIVLNIFVAFIIEAFLLQMQMSTLRPDEKLEHRMDVVMSAWPADAPRFRLAKTPKDAGAIYEKMFEDEIIESLNAERRRALALVHALTAKDGQTGAAMDMNVVEETSRGISSS